MGFLRAYRLYMDESDNPEAAKAHQDLFEACIDNGLRDCLLAITDTLKEGLGLNDSIS